jgi:hypothetical protein
MTKDRPQWEAVAGLTFFILVTFIVMGALGAFRPVVRKVERPTYVIRAQGCSVGRCRILLPGQTLTNASWKGDIPAIYAANGKRLTAYPERYPHDAACPQYALDDGPTVVGFVTCNNDVFVYGKRPVLVAWKEG